MNHRRESSRMPFLHGFRRIIFEYQPLVDEILECMDPLVQDMMVSPSAVVEDDRRIAALNNLLERNANSVYYQEGVSYSLLKMAEYGVVQAAEALLRGGADITFEDPITYYTSLHIAVMRNKPDMVELLVQEGADINRRDRVHESSPLDLASEEPERLPCLKRLLELGADVNAVDKHGKTALLHALASSDGVQIHNTENIRLLLEGGANVKATTKDGDSVFSYIIFLLGETVGGDEEEVRTIKSFCFQVTQLLMTHGANPSACPTYESLTHLCLKNFRLHFPLLRFLLEFGASYNCTLHGPSCWSGFSIIFEQLCSHLSGSEDDAFSVDLFQKAETVLELMASSSQTIKLPINFEINLSHLSGFHRKRISDLFTSLKQLEHSPPTLKQMCRVSLRQHLRPWPIDEKVKALPLPNLLKKYLLIDPSSSAEAAV
ncbi:ankyrin repeat and SOCS box protein 6 isoform X1 [Podarcis muralis]|uniref:Ankyrin repeat and SOCS box containing 6 n=1 Tax=Podarcis muralis TaxID=64176 RepID=A0A670KBG1_PODMU|nr:ankyrin repeat and SOCS box protein 6 isoform X1 [Podarcis muralis]XP_028571109.1 ankyrin repeat and SOCS box protein 6 isoform X1 [Podarcis muralis]XP_028571110.1 ankyrin repeat and SOCS box protein 6 isoform X1 [Podarcis muralis]XP_028571111.1 ankyrin repeat and SOCS box protein 6 isoform X1 [Podarcis muralis]